MLWLRPVFFGLLVTLNVCGVSQTLVFPATTAYSAKAKDLPELDTTSAKGLRIECGLAKTRFAIGEPVNIGCTVTNITDTTQPVGWHPNGSHFCLVQGDKTWGGILPLAIPELHSPILMKSRDMQPGYVFYLPPRQSMQFCLTYKGTQAEKFKGRVVYDPIHPREFLTNIAEELVFSNKLEYEVSAEGEK